ncbi:hypothetical protein R6G99_08160, partial [Actinotignum timonense]|nr:hypothetical protein [Actinotignum timonense]
MPSSGAFGQQRNIRYFALAFSVTRVQPHAQLSPCYFTAAATLTLAPSPARRSWGYARAEIISACLQATLLLGVGIFV